MNLAVRYKLMKADRPTEIGETIESMIRKQTTTNQPIDATAPIIFTPRKDGVIDDYNIRSDKWDRALQNMEQVAINRQTQRENWIQSLDDNNIETTPDSEQ